MPRFAVHVDDPDMDAAHDYVVWSPWESKTLARRIGARRALLAEGAMRVRVEDKFVRPLLPMRIRQALNTHLVSATAAYAVAVIHDAGDAPRAVV